MWLSLLGLELLPILAVLALLVGVPAFVVVVLAVVSGYIRHDAERRLAALEDGDTDDSGDESDGRE
ncbi:hypothetical protein [Natronococcus sp.]|uniref:hypothetical protein n=1 Tax=Natronococcus sp. TaxID=35747 RepID=UPI003A4DE849